MIFFSTLPFLCEMFIFRNDACLSVRYALSINFQQHDDITHIVLQVREAWLPLSPHSFQRRPWMRWSDRPCRSCRRPCRRPSARLTRWSAASGPRWSARWPRLSGRRPRTLSPLSTSRRTPARYAQTIQELQERCPQSVKITGEKKISPPSCLIVFLCCHSVEAFVASCSSDSQTAQMIRSIAFY